MDAMEVASIYSAKAVEYLVAVGYLLLFVPYWRFVNGSQGLQQPLRVAAPARGFAPAMDQTIFPGAAGLPTGHGQI